MTHRGIAAIVLAVAVIVASPLSAHESAHLGYDRR